MQRRRSVAPLLAALAMATLGNTALAAVTIDLGAASGHPSGQVQVPVTLAGLTAGAGGVLFDVLVPRTTLAVANPAAACALAPGVAGSAQTDLVEVAGTPAGMDRLRVIVLDFSGGSYANGPLATCTFTVAANAATGTFPLSGARVEVSDPVGNALAATVDAGAVSIEPCTGCCP